MQHDEFMFSPLDSAGEEQLRQARACIRRTFGAGGSGRRTKRALDMPAAPPTPAKTPRTKLRQRIERASHLSVDQIFSQEFGSCEELLQTEFDLARPVGFAAPTTNRHAVSTHSTQQQAAGGPPSFFSSAASTFTSSLPAPSTATVSQLPRSTRIRTPRKAAVKRARAGESSAEKELVLRKPRTGGLSSSVRSVDFSSAVGPSTAVPAFDARKSFAFVTTRGDHLMQPSAASRFFSRASPSKFQFSSNATRLFSQRQAPLR